MQKKYYPLVDAGKFVCALLVVFIHTFEVHDGHPAATVFNAAVCSQAVPFFFAASGFFFSKKIFCSDNIKKDTINYIKPLLIVYITWAVLWLPDTFLMYRNMYPEKSLIYWLLLIVRRDIFAGYGVYWYILVLIESAIVLSIFIRLTEREPLAKKLLCVIAAAGLIWDILYSYDVSIPVIKQLNSLVYTVFSWSNNIFMKVIPFTVVGYFFAKHYSKPYSLKILIPAYAVTLAASVLLVKLTGKDCNPLLIIEAVLLMAMIIRPVPVFLADRKMLFSEMRNISSAFYVTHPVIIYLLIDKIWGVEFDLGLRYLLALSGCTVIYILARMIKLKPVNKMLMIK